AGEDSRSEGHQLGDAAPVADALEDVGGDERDGLGMIQLEAAGTAPPRQVGGGDDQQLVDLALGQPHDATSAVGCSSAAIRAKVAIISCTTRGVRSSAR